MSAELDMSQYLDLFMQEAEEQLDILETETLKLEEDPSQDRLQIIFRAAHTLKGSSRAMGFSGFAELTHEMENVLDKLRAGELAVTTEIADALLSCQDTLRQMAADLGAGNQSKLDVSPLVQRLQSFQGEAQSAPASAEPVTGIELPEEVVEALRAAEAQAPVYVAKIKLAADCAMKFVRAFMAVSAIEEGGEVLFTLPEREKLEEEEFEDEFLLAFHSSVAPAEMHQRLAAITEVVAVEVTGLSDAAQKPEAKLEPSTVGTAPVKPDALAQPQSNASKGAKKGDSGQTVRVDVTRLDNLMNLVGELVIDRTRIAQIGSELGETQKDPKIDELLETVRHIGRISTDLQDQIMKTRMLPIDTVFSRLPRVVRDTAHKLGKDVHFEVVGGETELDRSVIEVIGDPLIHIIRNSLDHGLESAEGRKAAGKPATGNVTVSARHDENHIVIEIVDDGKGIDVERIKAKAVENGTVSADQAAKMSEKEGLQLIFASGLSTASEVSEVSGRGVGMDIVRSNIQKLGGLIDLETTLGEGTRFSLRLPLTLAIIRGLLVEVQNTVYVIPLGSVVETLLVEGSDIQSVNGQEAVVIRGSTTPLVRVRDVFGCPTSGRRKRPEFVVIVGLAELRAGLVVDRLIGEQEVVIKSLSRFCGEIKGVSGATIMGDGNVALILDVSGVLPKQRAR